MGDSNCRPQIFVTYIILFFKLYKCSTSFYSYRNKLIASAECETMEQTYTELSEILFIEAEGRCAVASF